MDIFKAASIVPTGRGQVREIEEGLLSLKGFLGPRFKEQACMRFKTIFLRASLVAQ